MQIKFAARGTEDWNKALDLVKEKFKKTFEAEVMPNPDYFVTCMIPSPAGDGIMQVASCASLSYASDHKMFAEQYLDEPIEDIIGDREGRLVQRDEILEIGSIVSLIPKTGLALVKAFPMVVLCLGKRYVLSTATKQLQAVFGMAGLKFEILTIADPNRLETDPAKWGSYYEHTPETGYFSLEACLPALGHSIGCYRMADIDMQFLAHHHTHTNTQTQGATA
ncbi:MAG: hypothetical protein RL748_2 [Pseudomonadota bacterium]